MGWWSATIMGGDAPLDAEGDILEFIGAPQDDDDFIWEDQPALVKPLLEKVSVEQWNAFFDKCDGDDYANVCRQVAVVLHMGVGAALPKALAEQAIAASSSEDVSGWNSSEERGFYLNSFIETIQSYNGTPTQIANESLFEKLAEHLTPKSRKLP
jgi:hypothetical protein